MQRNTEAAHALTAGQTVLYAALLVVVIARLWRRWRRADRIAASR